MNTFSINHKEYPEFMFAMISSFLPKRECEQVRKLAGNVVFKHEDIYGNTYKNGLLHSFDDKPAFTEYNYSDETLYTMWYSDGKYHRDGDKPAVIHGNIQEWYQHGIRHRSDDKPAYRILFF